MSKHLHVKTTERDYYYDDKDFKDSNIEMHFGADGRGIGLLKIEKSEFTYFEFFRKVGEEEKIEIHNPNWDIYLKIFQTALEDTGFLNGQRSQTRIMGEIRFYSNKGDIMREDNFDWSAWHYSFRCSKLPKEEKDKNNVTN